MKRHITKYITAVICGLILTAGGTYPAMAESTTNVTTQEASKYFIDVLDPTHKIAIPEIQTLRDSSTISKPSTNPNDINILFVNIDSPDITTADYDHQLHTYLTKNIPQSYKSIMLDKEGNLDHNTVVLTYSQRLNRIGFYSASSLKMNDADRQSIVDTVQSDLVNNQWSAAVKTAEQKTETIVHNIRNNDDQSKQEVPTVFKMLNQWAIGICIAFAIASLINIFIIVIKKLARY